VNAVGRIAKEDWSEDILNAKVSEARYLF